MNVYSTSFFHEFVCIRPRYNHFQNINNKIRKKISFFLMHEQKEEVPIVK